MTGFHLSTPHKPAESYPPSPMAFDHQRITTAPEPVAARSPASKKIKLATPFNPNPSDQLSPPQHQQQQQSNVAPPSSMVGDKGVQTMPVPGAESNAGVKNSCSNAPPGTFFPFSFFFSPLPFPFSFFLFLFFFLLFLFFFRLFSFFPTFPRVSLTPKDRTPSLQSIRATIQEQFDIEILLKHRELGNIEKEIAKTQVAMEQLRRCALMPYADSTEASLHAQLNYKPPSANPHNIPDYAPPPEGVVDGPYTRHYRQWLITHQRFDGPSAPAYSLPSPVTPGVAVAGIHQSLSSSGRPQRQSAMKVQTKTGEQVCLYRKRDGVLVRCVLPIRRNFPITNFDLQA